MKTFLKIFIPTVILLGSVGAFWLYQATKNTSSPTVSLLESYFPISNSTTSLSDSNDNTLTNSSSSDKVVNNTDTWSQIISQVSPNPVSSYTVFENKNGSTSVVFLEKEKGNIYLAKEKGERTRLSNLTIKDPLEAYFSLKNDNIRAIVKSEGNQTLKYLLIDNLSLKNPSSTPQEKVSEQSIPQITVSPDKDRMFYLVKNSRGVSGYLEDSKGKNNLVFNSPLEDWIIDWPNKEIITFQTKASHNTPGFLYFYNLSTRKMTKVLGNLPGLITKVSPDGKKILYSISINGSIELYLLELDKNESKKLDFQTLAEKCAWSQDSQKIYCSIPKQLSSANYPDDWYKGKIAFKDELFSKDLVTGANYFIPLPENINLKDIHSLSLTSKEKKLYFLNKENILYLYSF